MTLPGVVLTILATPRSEIFALMSVVNSTLLVERSRWMMGSCRSWRYRRPTATSWKIIGAVDLLGHDTIVVQELGRWRAGIPSPELVHWCPPRSWCPEIGQCVGDKVGSAACILPGSKHLTKLSTWPVLRKEGGGSSSSPPQWLLRKSCKGLYQIPVPFHEQWAVSIALENSLYAVDRPGIVYISL